MWFWWPLGLLVILFHFVYWKQEKEPNDILEEKNTPVRLDTPAEKEDQRDPPMGQQSQGSSPRQPDVKPEKQESVERSSLQQPSQEQLTQGEDEEQEIPWKQSISRSCEEQSLKLGRIKRQMKITLGIFFSHNAEEVWQ